MKEKGLMSKAPSRFFAASLHNKLFLFVIICSVLSTSLLATKHPVVFIHGFLGWGDDEMLGFKYWGGEYDIIGNLEKLGYPVYSVSVGPISSNYDRAIEAYYQIKGGELDYGNKHSEKFGLIQKPGIIYEGLYPKWSADNPIHIIGHSQGGQTARVLEYLLNFHDINESSDLLASNKSNWVKSITSISTPHEGTQLISFVMDSAPFIQALSGLTNLFSYEIIKSIYDFDLYQWKDLEMKSGESPYDYFARLASHPIAYSKNFSVWDLSPDGAHNINKYAINYPNTAYFSYSTSTTLAKESGRHQPSKYTNIDLWPSSIIMGHYNSGNDTIWNENDGIVNTRSMAGPTTPKEIWKDRVITYNQNKKQLGVWQDMGTLQCDHHTIIGHGFNHSWAADSLLKFYENHIKILSLYE